ncbi:MAG: glutamine--fructose-6-phosphate transaminase (isomerizing) [Firmicutes bacterium]|nr:glutamine--fructose-6-phosphate transaminase (isomerizing) [Bacillota bacterium]
MCGIVGYAGVNEAAPVLLKGLEKLEYRGYDSAGIAVLNGREIEFAKAAGKLQVLRDLTEEGATVHGRIGIGHTRWATHGEPSDVNAHPHVSNSGRFAVVHNGIIENYQQLKAMLLGKGFTFLSQTDTEVIAQLVEYYYGKCGDMLETMCRIVGKLEGSYALGILCADQPDRFYAVRKDSPLVLGLGEGANLVASDVSPMLAYTQRVCYLDDQEIVVLQADNVAVYDINGERIEKEVTVIDWDVSAAEKGGYEHFMFKEIMEQPQSLQKTISPRLQDGEIVLDDFHITRERLEDFRKIYIVACGSSYHVGAVGKYVLEQTTRIPVEVDIASEFRYRNPIIDEHTLMIVISQSGETADTIAAMREGKRQGSHVLAIVNVLGSTIAREADDVLYTWAGPEIAVATTKAYSTQLAVIYLLALKFAELLGTMAAEERAAHYQALQQLPQQMESLLAEKEEIQFMASQLYNKHSIFFIGRNLDYAVALEGSLKLKEISYIHSEAYAGGELKHGTISLIEQGTLVVTLATHDALVDKIKSNAEEVKARGAYLLAVAVRGDERMAEVADAVFYVPRTLPLLQPSLTVLPLQLFSYYVASQKGCSIDQPKNLAKSVTVE